MEKVKRGMFYSVSVKGFLFITTTGWGEQGARPSLRELIRKVCNL